MKNTSKSRNKIVFVQSLYYPDYSAGSQLLSDLSFYLAEKGWKVSVITSRTLYDKIDVKLSKFERINNVDVYRTWSTNFGRKSLLSRIIDYITFKFSIVIKLLITVKKRDIVVLMTDPPLLTMIATPIVLIKGGIILNWIQDLYPELALEPV